MLYGLAFSLYQSMFVIYVYLHCWTWCLNCNIMSRYFPFSAPSFSSKSKAVNKIKHI